VKLKKVNLTLTLDNNFGEIEMCLNKQLAYNIKVKSRVCELFVLKKDDFLRLSVNFKGFIEKFLKRSLYRFLKLIDDLNEITASFNNEGGVDVTKSLKPLESIAEQQESEEEEEYNANQGYDSDKDPSQTEKEKEEEEEPKNTDGEKKGETGKK
jgi:hypothetical protein